MFLLNILLLKVIPHVASFQSPEICMHSSRIIIKVARGPIKKTYTPTACNYKIARPIIAKINMLFFNVMQADLYFFPINLSILSKDLFWQFRLSCGILVLAASSEWAALRNQNFFKIKSFFIVIFFNSIIQKQFFPVRYISLLFVYFCRKLIYQARIFFRAGCIQQEMQ